MDLTLSPNAQAQMEVEVQETEEVANDTFEVNLMDAGVEDEDIISLRGIKARLVKKIKEMPTTSNVQTRAQV
jgi:hypothetical protein